MLNASLRVLPFELYNSVWAQKTGMKAYQAVKNTFNLGMYSRY